MELLLAFEDFEHFNQFSVVFNRRFFCLCLLFSNYCTVGHEPTRFIDFEQMTCMGGFVGS